MGERFPILERRSDTSLTIPWEVIAPHEARARANHGGQTLKRLAERRGLSWCEALAVLNDRPWRKVDPDAAHEAVMIIVVRFLDRARAALKDQPPSDGVKLEGGEHG